MTGIKVGYALCGSFCTINKSLKQLENLIVSGAEVTPIMSEIVYRTDTRFGSCKDINSKVTELCKKDIITTVKEAEPIGPKNLLDILIVSPCTGNTLAKISTGITDGPVTMAVKAHLRNNKPVLLAIATNDALAASAQNIGKLINTKNIYFVPFGQDDPENKPTSIICDFEKIIPAAKAAIDKKQIQPILL